MASAPTTEEFLRICPKFRILLLGKTGIGKTTLIKRAFGVDSLEASHLVPGECNIETEIVSPIDDRFIIHDSQGFEPGEVKNFDTVMQFIQKRNDQPDLKDKLHAIWHCVQVPHAGARTFERGDENFLRFMEMVRIPTIVVFTKYDRLFNQIAFKTDGALLKGMDEDQIDSFVDKQTEEKFKESVAVVKQVNAKLHYAPVSHDERFHDMYARLMETTIHIVRNHVAKATFYVKAVEQRRTVDRNVEVSTGHGIKKYWRDLASRPHSNRSVFRYCFEKIHPDIIDVWKLDDPDQILVGNTFKAMILRIQGSLNHDPTLDQASSQELIGMQDAVAELNALLSAEDLAIVPSSSRSLGMSRWKPLPGDTLRTLMGFILHLIMVLERLYWNNYRKNTLSVTMQEVETAFEEYCGSGERNRVREDVFNFAKDFDPASLGDAYVEAVRLVETHRLVESQRSEREGIWPQVSKGGSLGRMMRRIYQAQPS